MNKSRLTSAEIAEFRTLLLLKRAEILGDVTSMEGETLRRQRSDLSNLPFHLADAGSDNYEIDNTLGLMDSEVRLIEQIDEALERIERREYGICQARGEPIPKGRLKAIPWATYCVTCASLREKGLLTAEEGTPHHGYDYRNDEELDGGSERRSWKVEKS